MRRKLILLPLLLLAVALAAPGTARAQGGDNTAVAINTRDGASIFRLAFSIKRVAGEVVDNTNAAVAFSSCNSCQTTAIAVQIVFITGEADTITPTNLAIAINYECSTCETFAAAYQWVLTTDGPVHFTAEGNREIAAIRRELRELAKLDLSPAELDARIDALMDRLARVLKNELVAAGRSGDAESRDDHDDDAGGETTTAPPATVTAPPPTTTEEETTTEFATTTTTP